MALLLFGVIVFSVDRRHISGLVRFESTSRLQPTSRSQSVKNGHVKKSLPQVSPTSNVSVGLVDYCVGDSYATHKKLIAYNRQTYADKWGYTIFSGDEEVFPMQTFVNPLAWLKAAYLYQLLSGVQARDIEWFLWMDCDALITRFDLNVDDLLLDLNVRPEHHVVVAQDPHAEFKSGVMFVRSSEWSRDLWKRTLQKASNVSIREHIWWEQQALLELYRENRHQESTHILITPDRWKINVFRTPRRNEFNASSFALHRVDTVTNNQSAMISLKPSFVLQCQMDRIPKSCWTVRMQKSLSSILFDVFDA